MKRRLDGHGNAKYTSHQIQNEILEGLADMVRKQIITEVKESEVFSILADETRDLQKRNKFLWWCDIIAMLLYMKASYTSSQQIV